jgi:hypothetical protein
MDMDKMLRIKEVEQITGLSRTSIWRHENDPESDFPSRGSSVQVQPDFSNLKSRSGCLPDQKPMVTRRRMKNNPYRHP